MKKDLRTKRRQQKQRTQMKNEPVFIPSAVRDWYCNATRSMYVHKNGAVVVQENAQCKGCLKKFRVRHANMKIEKNLIRAGASLFGGDLDRFVTGKADTLIAAGTMNDEISASPMKTCIECGQMATLFDGCKCKKTMADKNGMVMINVSGYKIEGVFFKCFLDMRGYPLIPLVFRKDQVKPGDLLRIKGMLSEGTKDKPTHVHVDYKQIRGQLIRSKQNEQR